MQLLKFCWKRSTRYSLNQTRAILIALLCFVAFTFIATESNAASLATRLSGKILLNVEKDGEAWYVYPEDERRYFLGRPADAFALMRELGLGIREIDFQKLAKSDMPEDVEGDLALARSLSGKIILQVEKNGEAWYVNPDDLRIYFLGRPKDAFEIMRRLSLGISRENLALIHKPGTSESVDDYSAYSYDKYATDFGTFSADIIEIDMNDPDLEIVTDTANLVDCEYDCSAKTLGAFVLENDAFAGINGTYFEAYSGKINYYFAPVYNTEEEKLLNTDQLKYWTTGAIMVFDEDNNFYYFKDTREFGSVEEFEKKHNTKIQAAISNKPRLVEEGRNQLVVWQVDGKQENAKADRNAIAYKADDNGGKGSLYLIALHGSTLLELAEFIKFMGYDYALNLDGGYSSALWYNDEYMVKPGRDIPNAILFRKR